jgi:GGDEF domain-containing protein
VGKRTCPVAGDEFAIIVQGGLETAVRAAERLGKALAGALRAGGPTADLTCSIGIAQYPEHGARPVRMANAVLAMRSVKMAGDQMRQDEMVDHIEAARRSLRIPPGRLTCEITETQPVDLTPPPPASSPGHGR